MGLLRDLTAPAPSGSPADVGPLRDLLSAVVTADGKVDMAEHISVEAMFETIPQLRGAPHDERPPQGRKAFLAQLGRVTDEKLRKQMFVLAVDLALASEGANDREDAFVEELRSALRIDEAFARQTITVLSHKYALGR